MLVAHWMSMLAISIIKKNNGRKFGSGRASAVPMQTGTKEAVNVCGRSNLHQTIHSFPNNFTLIVSFPKYYTLFFPA